MMEAVYYNAAIFSAADLSKQVIPTRLGIPSFGTSSVMTLTNKTLTTPTIHPVKPANCRNCGAPPKVMATECEYCRTRV